MVAEEWWLIFYMARTPRPIADGLTSPLRVSWTNLTRYQECKKQSKLYLQGMRDSSLSNARNFAEGSITDVSMRKFLENDPAPGKIMQFAEESFAAWMDENKENTKWRESYKKDSNTIKKNVTEALLRLEPWLLENVVPYEYQPEARGTATLKLPDAQGNKRTVELFFAVDILTKLPESFWIADLKTTRNASYIKGKTLGQLSYYALAISIAQKIPVDEIYKLSFVTPLTKEIETAIYPTSTDYAVMLKTIQNYALDMWSSEPMPTKEAPDFTCKTQCEVRHVCPLMQAPPVEENGTLNFMNIVEQRKKFAGD